MRRIDDRGRSWPGQAGQPAGERISVPPSFDPLGAVDELVLWLDGHGHWAWDDGSPQ
jgi:hypothetical protein